MASIAIEAPGAATGVRYIEWGPVIAGAFATAAILFVLLAFGAALGLSAVSPWPNSGMSATTMAIIGAFWTVVIHVFSFAVGGYIAGRLRTGLDASTANEHHFRDGAHGFVVWAVAIVIGAMLAGSIAGGAVRTTAQAGAAAAGGAVAAGGAAAAGMAAGGTIDPRDLGVDLLLREGPAAPTVAGGAPAPTTQAPAAAPHAAASEENRGALVRVFGAALRDGTLPARDRSYLAQVVARRTGLAQADAEKRVDEAFNDAKAAEAKAREAADKARKATALAGFLAAACFAVACLAACFAAGRGGRDRDEGKVFTLFAAERLW